MLGDHQVLNVLLKLLDLGFLLMDLSLKNYIFLLDLIRLLFECKNILIQAFLILEILHWSSSLIKYWHLNRPSATIHPLLLFVQLGIHSTTWSVPTFRHKPLLRSVECICSYPLSSVLSNIRVLFLCVVSCCWKPKVWINLNIIPV